MEMAGNGNNNGKQEQEPHQNQYVPKNLWSCVWGYIKQYVTKLPLYSGNIICL